MAKMSDLSSKKEHENSTQLPTKKIDLQQKEMHDIRLQNNGKVYILNLSNRNHSPTHSPIFNTLNRENNTQIVKHQVMIPFLNRVNNLRCP
jgi:hypothetical protein